MAPDLFAPPSVSGNEPSAVSRSIPGAALYAAFCACRDGSLFQHCSAFEAALIDTGWTPPAEESP
jgi:hypothetical protein